MTWDEVVRLAVKYPLVEVSTSYGEPSLKVRKKLLCRLRLADQSIVVLGVLPPERDHLLSAYPDTFFLEPHYEAYDIVLARLLALDAGHLQALLDRRWRALATKRVIKDWDEAMRRAD